MPAPQTGPTGPTGPTEPTEPTEQVRAVRALARASSVLERASSEVSLAHYRVLAAISSGDARASRIADKLAIGKPTISSAVDSLEQRGLLERGPVATDRRAAALRLTPAGERLLQLVETEMIARLEDLCARSPDGDRLLQSLTWLGEAIDARMSERHPVRRASGS
jgi:DNA-binding MarR family transcriptional regulator